MSWPSGSGLLQNCIGLHPLRASRVQISSGLLGLLFHASGVERPVRNEIYKDRPAERCYDALDWIVSAPDCVRGFR
ncbi:MAG: hypothetical protein HY067_20130 [Betaproteobacteria bacterium]|nr:hypothetical protein [Betaproteobacteria bacterium]